MQCYPDYTFCQCKPNKAVLAYRGQDCHSNTNVFPIASVSMRPFCPYKEKYSQTNNSSMSYQQPWLPMFGKYCAKQHYANIGYMLTYIYQDCRGNANF